MTPSAGIRWSDDHTLTAMRGLRQGAYGMLGVVLAVALLRRGLSPTAIGALVTVSLAGDFCGTIVIGHYADAWGRRRTLATLAVLMALTGIIFGLVAWYPILLIAAFFGTLGTAASETAPFLPIEQAMLGQTGDPADRTRRFAHYNLVASLAGALGALLAGFPDVLAQHGVSVDAGLRLAFGLYALAALCVAVLAWRLSPSVEAEAGHVVMQPGWWRRILPPLHASRGIILRLAGLFTVDAFAGALVNQTLMALFFHLRFGVPLGQLAALFFGANLLAALSFLAAPALARRFGLLNTMVFTHLPSNILLILVALMPVFPLAAVMLLLRQTLSQLDVPTRQAYTMAVVAPDERTAAASTTSLARSAGSASSPVISGALLQGPLVALGLPFLISGGLKVIYDLAVWGVFRHMTPPEEANRTAVKKT